MADVFVSYARPDRNRVQALAAALEGAGWSVWWDREILAGSEFETVIQAELDSARCVLVAWSATSVASPWVRNEASEGLKRRILLPVTLDDSSPPLAFRHIQGISFGRDPIDATSPAFHDLIRSLARLVPQTERDREKRDPTEDLKPTALPGRSSLVDASVVPESGGLPVDPVPAMPRRRATVPVLAIALVVAAIVVGYVSSNWQASPQPVLPPIDPPVLKTAPASGQSTPAPPEGERPAPSISKPRDPKASSSNRPPQGPVKGPSPIAEPSEKPSPEEARSSLKQHIAAGGRFEVEFDRLTEPVGTIGPGRYSVAYISDPPTWWVSGSAYPDGKPQDVRTPAPDICDPDRYALCLWGAPFRYDDEGQVFLAGTRRIGRIHR